ncbi:MAG: DUF4238 domain-containing protein [Alphaproteobacteria bacterium]|nr:DUF4238 domain-containing protein [Alphaproteobacteria bacterium]
MLKQESKNHHFVPQFLLRPWEVEPRPGQRDLRGYWWDQTRIALACKVRGVRSFCFQIDLLTLRDHPLGRDAIERIFFGPIDTKGAAAQDVLMRQGPNELSGDQRCDFARLLLSLEARRPLVVNRLRTMLRDHLASELDADPEIRAAMVEQGISEPASSYLEKQHGSLLEDSALTIVQNLVENPEIGGQLINAHWGVRRLDDLDGSLVLSDRPLIRIHGYDKPGANWVLPMNPHAAFVACNDQANLAKLMGLSGQRFVKAVNVSSAAQAERFVFCADQSHEQWLNTHLRPKG